MEASFLRFMRCILNASGDERDCVGHLPAQFIPAAHSEASRVDQHVAIGIATEAVSPPAQVEKVRRCSIQLASPLTGID